MLSKNKAQEKVIDKINGRVLLVSCPGSGKTTTLLRRINNMIKQGVKPEKILMITFTKNSAEDMQKRYKELFGTNHGINFSTIHSLCYKILKEEKIVKNGSVIDEDDTKDFFIKRTKNIREIQYADDVEKVINNIISEISFIKNNDIDIKKYQPESCRKDLFENLSKNYDYHKEKIEKVDFDDMLIKVRELFYRDEDALKRWQRKYNHIQVDEYQDTNNIQKDIIYMLEERHKNLCLVGDDDQSIYSFRGASSDIMLNFPKEFDNVNLIEMSTNYRSGGNIVNLADSLIKNNEERFYKNLISFRNQNDGSKDHIEFDFYNNESEEAESIAKKIIIEKSKGIKSNEIAILYRNNIQSRIIATNLIQYGIEFKINERVKTIYEN